MKKHHPLLLLLGLLITLGGCINLPGDATPTDTSTHTTAPPLSGGDPITPLYPSFTHATDTALLFFRLPGVVDVSLAEYSYESMQEDLATLAETYPDRLALDTIGRSADGREIPVAILGNPNATRQILVSAGLHGREYLTPLLVMKQLEFYLAYYDTGSHNGRTYRELFAETCFYVIPMSNPDGIMLSEVGISAIRTANLAQAIRDIHASDLAAGRTQQKDLNRYLRTWKANARGVDLNRNYDAFWESYRGVATPSYANYKGSAPASEPETQALISLVDRLPGLEAVLCIHSQGEVIYWNCGQPSALSSATQAYAKHLAERTGYTLPADLVRDASFSDWCALKKGLVAVTLETGKGACPLPISDLAGIWGTLFDLFPTAIEAEN